jgi:hypothetical protein
MKEWWNKYNTGLPKMNKEQKVQIEDITGKIPLFLNFLLEEHHKNVECLLEYLDKRLKSRIGEPMIKFSDAILGGDRWDL